MNKYTSGPWVAKQNASGEAIYIYQKNKEPALAVVNSKGRVAEAAEANARLMAAAPELLEALKAIMKNNPDLTSGTQWAEKRSAAFAAIAKAEGRES